jgi:hypothetical protein
VNLRIPVKPAAAAAAAAAASSSNAPETKVAEFDPSGTPEFEHGMRRMGIGRTEV